MSTYETRNVCSDPNKEGYSYWEYCRRSALPDNENTYKHWQNNVPTSEFYKPKEHYPTDILPLAVSVDLRVNIKEDGSRHYQVNLTGTFGTSSFSSDTLDKVMRCYEDFIEEQVKCYRRRMIDDDRSTLRSARETEK